MFSDRPTCCVPGCSRGASRVRAPGSVEVICEEHFALASPAALARRQRAEKRLQVLQQCWEDDDYFDRLVASGKYLKLCGTLASASDAADRAWAEIKTEVLGAATPQRQHAEALPSAA